MKLTRFSGGTLKQQLPGQEPAILQNGNKAAYRTGAEQEPNRSQKPTSQQLETNQPAAANNQPGTDQE